MSKRVEKKIKYIGNYYGHGQGQTGSIYSSLGVQPCICSIDWKPGKGLTLRKWKRK